MLARPQLLSWGATLSQAPGWAPGPHPSLSPNSYFGNNTLCQPHLPLQDQPSSHPPSQDWFSVGGGDAPRGNLTVLLHVSRCMGVPPPTVIQPQHPQCFAERPHVCHFQLHPQPASKLCPGHPHPWSSSQPSGLVECDPSKHSAVLVPLTPGIRRWPVHLSSGYSSSPGSVPAQPTYLFPCTHSLVWGALQQKYPACHI